MHDGTVHHHPATGGLEETARFRETLELRDSDHTHFTSYLQLDDGTWMKVVNWEYRRQGDVRLHPDG